MIGRHSPNIRKSHFYFAINIIRHVLDSADLLRPRFCLFPVQRVILDQGDYLLFLAVRVVLLTPIGGIRNGLFGHWASIGSQLLQMRNETSGIPRQDRGKGTEPDPFFPLLDPRSGKDDVLE
jgi:hypothetical protein